MKSHRPQRLGLEQHPTPWYQASVYLDEMPIARVVQAPDAALHEPEGRQCANAQAGLAQEGREPASQGHA